MVDVVKLKGLAAAQKEKREAGARQTQATNRIKSKLFGASTTPYVTTGPLTGSGSYSLLKAAAYAAHVIGDDMVKEERAVAEKLKKFYGQAFQGFPVVASANPMYHPVSLREDSEGLKFLKEVKEKTAAATAKYDPDEAAWHNEKRKAIGTFPATSGGSFIPPPIQMNDVIELQRNLEVFPRAGAMEVAFSPNGAFNVPRQTGAGTSYWVGEGATITDSTLSTGALELRAKKLGTLTTISIEAQDFSNPSLEALARNDMAKTSALAADLAMLQGTGGTQIKGLITYTGDANSYLNVVSYTASTTSATGDTFQPQDIMGMWSRLPDMIQDANVKWVMHPFMFAAIMNRRADAVSANDGKGPFVSNLTRVQNEQIQSYLNGESVIRSRQVVTTREKGASGAVLTYALLGHWPDWMIARYGVLDVLMNPYGSTFTTGQVQIRAIQFIDAGPRTPNSFIFCDQLIVG